MNPSVATPGGAWVRPLSARAEPGALRLFCVPHAGAGASAFRNWGSGLPDWVEPFAIQLPAREDRFHEPPLTDLDDLLDALAPSLLPYLDRPFAFFGHSLGAIVAWELARTVRRAYGREPVTMIVSGCRALQLRRPPEWCAPDLSDEGLVVELRLLAGTPEELLDNGDFRAFMLPTFRADRALFGGYVYRPGALLTCPVHAFGGSEDPRVDEDHLKAWAELTTGPCEVEIFPGGHLYLVDERDRVLSSVTRALSAARA